MRKLLPPCYAAELSVGTTSEPMTNEPSGQRLHPFFRADFVHGNVVFNFLRPAIGQLWAFAASYHEAGKILVAKMEASPGYRDYDGYPILFLYRHALELYLKAIVYHGAQLMMLRTDERLEVGHLLTKHRLSLFLPAVRAIFASMDWEWNFEVSGLRSLDDFETLVRGVEEVDRESYCFRYPVTKSGDAAHSPHLIINVTAFARRMDPVLDLLGGAITGLHEQWDLSAEVAYFLEELFKEEKYEP